MQLDDDDDNEGDIDDDEMVNENLTSSRRVCNEMPGKRATMKETMTSKPN